MRQTNYAIYVTVDGVRITDQVSKCPMCNNSESIVGYRLQGLTTLPKVASDTLYRSQQYVCPGCQKTGTSFDVSRHVLQCRSITVRCHFCDELVPSGEMATHIKTTCSHIACPISTGCGFSGTYSSIRRHIYLHKLFPTLMTARDLEEPGDIGDDSDLDVEEFTVAPILLEFAQPGLGRPELSRPEGVEGPA